VQHHLGFVQKTGCTQGEQVRRDLVSLIMPAAAVWLVAASTRMKAPVAGLRP
jgi:hypothetical protein